MTAITGAGANVYKGYENQFNEALEMKNALPAQRDAIKNDPNLTPEQKDAQLKNLDNVEKDINLALDFTTNSAKFDTNSGSIAGDKDMAAILGRLDAAKAGLEKMLAAVGTAAANAQTPADPPAHSCGGGGSGGVGGTGSQAADLSKSGDKAGDLVKMMSSNPNQFLATMKGMSAEDRQDMMLLINQKLQDSNQMFSMMSNFSKAQHDTAKALIGNMRV